MKKIYFILTVIITIFSINKLYANESKLVVHTYESFISDWGPGPQIEEEFEKVCNCDLQFIGIDSSIGILGRLKLEADETNADIILGLDTNLLTAAKNTKLLAKHNIDTSKIDLPIN